MTIRQNGTFVASSDSEVRHAASRIHLCRGRRSRSDFLPLLLVRQSWAEQRRGTGTSLGLLVCYGSRMVVAPSCCRVMLGRNRIGRPASPRRGDAAVEFISTQSPDVAVAMPIRMDRAE